MPCLALSPPAPPCRQPNQEPLQAGDPSGGDRTKRAKFSARSFAQAHVLGDPVAVAWFNSHK